MRFILFVLLVVFFSGCVSTGVTNITKDSRYDTIRESAVIFGTSDFKKASSECKKKIDETYRYLSRNHNLENELRTRNVKINYLENNPKYLIKMILETYGTKTKYNGCFPSVIGVIVEIEDISSITKSWTEKKSVGKKLNQLFANKDRKIIWKGKVTLALNKGAKLDDFSKILFESLDKSNVFPKKTKTMAEVEKIQEEKKQDRKREFFIACLNSEDNLKLNFNNSLKTLCIGKAGFTDVKKEYSNNLKAAIMKQATKIQGYSLKDNVCSSISYSEVDGELADKNLDFKHTYLEQVQKKYNNNCKVEKIYDLNYMECKNGDKIDYYIEKSLKDGNRIYNKKLLNVEEKCYKRLKKFNITKDDKVFEQSIEKQNEFKEFSLEKLKFKTELKDEKYNTSFYNGGIQLQKIDGKSYLVGKKYYGKRYKPTKIEEYQFLIADDNTFNLKKGEYLFIKKVVKNYKNQGYDEDGYDVRGFNKEGFNRFGYDTNGLDKDGYNKHGYNPKLRIQGKQVFDDDGYDQRGYDKNGLNKDGYDRDGWSPTLKKFKKR